MIILFCAEGEETPTLKKSKAYPYLKALLDALIEAAPNWMKAPGKFVSSLSEQLKDQGQKENKQLEKEITGISEEELRELIKEAGGEQKADLKFIVENIEPIVVNIKAVPEILHTINYRFDKVDDKLEQIIELVRQRQSVFSIGKQHSEGDIYEAGRDIIIHKHVEGEKEKEKVREKIAFPFNPSLHNQTAPEVNFVGRKDMLETITQWYKNPEVRIGVLIGWGGVGKSALVRKWYDELEANNIQPDGIFWWGFYRNAFLEQFLNALLRYVSGGQIEPDTIKGTWEKSDRIKEYIGRGAYLIILDGLEQMQEGKSGDEFGKMIHRELTELLHYLADVPKAGGMCLITTRFPLKDLDEWQNRGYENQPLIDLSIPDALLMLKKRGVKGSEEEMTGVIKRYKGHALSLTLLGGYLVEDFEGDITKAKEIPAFYSDEEAGGKAHRILLWYAKQLTEEQSGFMKIFSLFRRAVHEEDFEGVFRAKMETEMNQALTAMSVFAFKRMVDNLVDRRLISRDQDNTHATHPLIKNYFESIFDEKNKKLCHKRIYEYIGEYAPEKPETLEEMQPLFEQVYHGCAAGLYQETLDEVFYKKIHRYQEHLIMHKLGAWETDLSLAKTFFPDGDFSQMPLVSKNSAQGWLLGVAGLALLYTGRPKEAEGIISRQNEITIELKDWKNVSAGYENLADLRFITGDLEAGLDSAKKDFEMAEKAKGNIISSKAFIGWGLYLLGRTEEAEKNFKEADKVSLKIEGNQLRSNIGVFYTNFLISMERIDEAFELTRQNLEISKNILKDPNNISRCNRCLCAIERMEGNYEEAENHLKNALEIGRKVGMPALEIDALLESGRLGLDMGRYKDAIRDADNVLKICRRTGFKFYEPGAEVVLAKAYLALKDFEKAKTFANSAYEKAIGMKYRWAEGDTAHLLGEIYAAMGDKAKARKWLKKAVACRKEILDPKVKESETILAGLR